MKKFNKKAYIQSIKSLHSADQADSLESLNTENQASVLKTHTKYFHPDFIAYLIEETRDDILHMIPNKQLVNLIRYLDLDDAVEILGDFEIIGQIKQSFYRSKKMGLAQGNLERLINSVIQASKRIKTETQISSGATSVAFASVQYILKHVKDIAQKNILLFGTGKIGANTCENLVKHSQNDHIVLINRTQEKAEKIADKFPVQVKSFGALASSIRESDVLIVATSSQKPTVTTDLIHNKKPLLILDLSLPRNVDPELNNRPNTQVIHLDELSQITDATFERRRKFNF